MYLNVYLVTREFGGSEEGGWYYDNYECIHSELAENEENIEEEIERLEEEYASYKQGNISSVRGGTDVKVLYENYKSESETDEVPEYE